MWFRVVNNINQHKSIYIPNSIYKLGTVTTHASGFVVFCKRVRLLSIQRAARPRASEPSHMTSVQTETPQTFKNVPGQKTPQKLCIYLPVLLEAKHSSRAHTLQLTHRKIELYLIVLRPEYKSHVMPGDASFHQTTFFSLQGATAAVRLKRLTTENL